MSVMQDSFSLLSTANDNHSLALPDDDTAWLFDTDADELRLPSFGLGFTDIDCDIGLGDNCLPDGHRHGTHGPLTGLDAGQDSPSGYQTSHGSVVGSDCESASVSSVIYGSSSSSSSLSLSSSAAAAAAFTHSTRFPGTNSTDGPGEHFVNLTRQSLTQRNANHPLQCHSQRLRSETCLTTALRILTTLPISHTACLSAHREFPVAQQVRKMEAVLTANKDVIAGMHPILACSCSARSQVQLLLLSICGNLIAWNGAMLSDNDKMGVEQQAQQTSGDDLFYPATLSLSANPTTPKLKAAASASASAAATATGARVLAQPITIGQHQISGELGRVLHMQIMAGELRMLEGLLEALSRRFCEEAPAPLDGIGVASKGLSHNVHRHIISSLRMRLEKTRAMVLSRG